MAKPSARREDSPRSERPSTDVSPEMLRSIVAAIRSLRYGAIEITVHDGRVVQIERREKYRFPSTSSDAGGSSPTT